MRGRVPVAFDPPGVTVWVEPGTSVLEAGRLAGVAIDAQCGGRGVCGRCAVRVRRGALADPSADEARALARTPSGVRLACRARIAGPVTVEPLPPLVEPSVPRAASSDRGLVAGVDLGTTTVVASVLEVATGREIGTSVVVNRQRSYGGDVLSRLGAVLEGHGEELREAALVSIEDAINGAGAALASLDEVVVAGNAAMTAILAGADVRSLAHAPFAVPDIPERLDPGVMSPDGSPWPGVRLVPPLAPFIGGDVAAGLVGLRALEQPSALLLDIGTNAEVVLARAGSVIAASAPAGPAFDGVGIAAAGPAIPGAVVRVSLDEDGDLALETLGGAAPTHLSGAGLVSALALLRSSGHLDPEGSLVPDGPLGARFARDAEGVVSVDLGLPDTPLPITQRDVRALQLAKAALQVAVEAVLSAGDCDAVERVWLAGAFGRALSADDLCVLGMLPRGIGRVAEAVGNASLLGACALALEPALFEGVGELQQAVRAIDLASEPGFTDRLLRAMRFEAT